MITSPDSEKEARAWARHVAGSAQVLYCMLPNRNN